MRSRRRSAITASAGILLSLLLVSAGLAGCAGDSWTEPGPVPSPIGVLGDGFEPSASPAPEATIRPAPDSWDEVRPSPGYRVVLLTAGDDRPTETIAGAVREWAEEEDVDLREVVADEGLIEGIVEAMDLQPDLVVTAGNDLIDPLATVSASHLDQPFLVIGAEVPEPTRNVTAVDWIGASFRGEGLAASSPYDADTFTDERSAEAVRAGVAAVLHDLTGIVVWID